MKNRDYVRWFARALIFSVVIFFISAALILLVYWIAEMGSIFLLGLLMFIIVFLVGLLASKD